MQTDAFGPHGKGWAGAVPQQTFQFGEVTRTGTAASASLRLERQDLAGKTGTTRDAVDGWFAVTPTASCRWQTEFQ